MRRRAGVLARVKTNNLMPIVAPPGSPKERETARVAEKLSDSLSIS